MTWRDANLDPDLPQLTQAVADLMKRKSNRDTSLQMFVKQPEVVEQDSHGDRIYTRCRDRITWDPDLQRLQSYPVTGDTGARGPEAQETEEPEPEPEPEPEDSDLPELVTSSEEESDSEGNQQTSRFQEAIIQSTEDPSAQEDIREVLTPTGPAGRRLLQRGGRRPGDHGLISREMLQQAITECIKDTKKNDYVTIATQENMRVMERLRIMLQMKQDIMNRQKGLGALICGVMAKGEEVMKELSSDYIRLTNKPAEKWNLGDVKICQKVMDESIRAPMAQLKYTVDQVFKDQVIDLLHLRAEMKALEVAFKEIKNLEVRLRVTPMPLPVKVCRLKDLALRPGEKQVTIGDSSMIIEKAVMMEDGTYQFQLMKESFKPLRTNVGWGLPMETYIIPLTEEDEITDSEESSEEDEENEEMAMES